VRIIDELHTRPADFTAAELTQMSADQEAHARELRRQGSTSDADIWQQWARQTREQARRTGLPPLTDDEWDGD
jgi:hypothetical protein